jgi:hypothetical protein
MTSRKAINKTKPAAKFLRKLGPALLCAGLVFGLLVTGPELAAQRTSGASQYIL